MSTRLAILLALFAAFTGWTGYLVATEGYTGFIELALTDVWGAQLLIDLSIALVLFTAWMIPDARSRGIRWLPYGAAILTLGSVGALAYLIHREVTHLRSEASHGHASRQLQSS